MSATGRTVVLVDDAADVRVLLQLLLELEGPAVTATADDSCARTDGSALALRAAVRLEQPRPDTSVLADVLAQLRRTVDGPT